MVITLIIKNADGEEILVERVTTLGEITDAVFHDIPDGDAYLDAEINSFEIVPNTMPLEVVITLDA